MRDLAPGMHTGIRPTGDAEFRWEVEPKHASERVLQDTLDGAVIWLTRPPYEIRAVVSEVKA